MPAFEGGGFLGEEEGDHLHPLVEAVHPLGDGSQRKTVGIGFQLVPAGAQPEVQPPAGDDVERRRHVGGHRRVAEMHPVNHAADPEPGGGLGQRRQSDPRLQARTGRIAGDRVEVIEGPRRLEQLDLVGLPPDLQDVAPAGVMRLGLEGEADHIPFLV